MTTVTMMRQANSPSRPFSRVDREYGFAYRERSQVILLSTIRRTLLIILGQCALILRTGVRRQVGPKAWYPAHHQHSLPAGCTAPWQDARTDTRTASGTQSEQYFEPRSQYQLQK